jgi:glycosyltransferase involved in cell wall biosynthesis
VNDVSIVLCTYNGERFLPALLRSLDRQEGGWAEMIVHDDGSTDSTVAILEAYALVLRERGTSIKLIVNDGPTRGPAQAFSFAAGFASHRYVAFADQDDIWSPARLSSALEALTDPDAELVASDAELVDGSDEGAGGTVFGQFVSRLMPHGAMLNRPLHCLIRQNYLPGMTMTVERSALDAWLPVPPGWLHDYWFAIRAADRGSLRVLPDALVRYRQHESNVLGVQRQLSVRRLYGALRSRMTSSAGSRSSTADWTVVSDLLRPIRDPELASKLVFEKGRSEFLGLTRPRRVIPILRALGGYRRFSHIGLAGALRDLI